MYAQRIVNTLNSVAKVRTLPRWPALTPGATCLLTEMYRAIIITYHNVIQYDRGFHLTWEGVATLKSEDSVNATFWCNQQ